MKLYYSAGSCSTSCHISLEESGLPYEAIAVDFDNPNDPNLAVIEKLNPLGTLPIFITDEGKQLDQNLSIHAYIAAKAPAKNLLPQPGTPAYAEALNMMAFINSDYHKSIGGMFGLAAYANDKNVQSTVRSNMLTRANEVLKYLDNKLAGKNYILGENFSAIDAYAYVVTTWTKYLDVSIKPYSNIEKYLARVESRPAVAKVLKEEGLV
jgi:glutathione S-transferase